MSTTAKLYEVKIKLSSSWLGSQRTRENVRRFRRDANSNIAVDVAQWSWTFKQAAEALHMDGTLTDTIRPQANLMPPSLVLYRRNYTHNNKPQMEMFEAIREGTVLTFNVVVTDSSMLNASREIGNPPDLARLKDIFQFSGAFLGLSPWGNQYGYGRFDLESLKVI